MYNKPPGIDDQGRSWKDLADFLRLMTEMRSASAEALLKFGRPFVIDGYTFSERRMPKKQCFANAARVAFYHSGRTYCEGYVDVGVPIEHAWVVDAVGNVIDHTIRPDKGTGKYDRVNGYYGIAFNRDFLAETLVRRKVYGLLFDNPDLDWHLAGAELPTFLHPDFAVFREMPVVRPVGEEK